MRLIRTAMPVVLAVTLAACAGGGRRNGLAPAVYDLGVAPAAVATGEGSLAMAVQSAEWLESTAIQYRLAYAESGRRRDYALARWAAPPAALAEQRLLQRLGLHEAGRGGARCLLRVNIDEFSQVFSAPDVSHGLLQARVTLSERGRGILAEMPVRIEEPAAAADSRGGAAALAAAVERLAGLIAEWRRELAAAGRLGACGR